MVVQYRMQLEIRSLLKSLIRYIYIYIRYTVHTPITVLQYLTSLHSIIEFVVRRVSEMAGSTARIHAPEEALYYPVICIIRCAVTATTTSCLTNDGRGKLVHSGAAVHSVLLHQVRG